MYISCVRVLQKTLAWRALEKKKYDKALFQIYTIYATTPLCGAKTHLPPPIPPYTRMSVTPALRQGRNQSATTDGLC